MTDLCALYDALNTASLAVLVIEGEGDRTAEAEAAFLEASFAAGDAFPLDSPESEALGVILAAIGRAMKTGAAS